jgi:hypothetical protein
MHRFLIVTAAIAISACAQQTAPENGDETSDDQVADTVNCPVIESSDWAAWVDKEPGADAVATLHVTGNVTLPTPGYTESWELGIADRAMPPGQHLHLILTPPEGMVAQVITPQEVHYQAVAQYPAYRAVMVRCGDEMLAEISPVPEAL